MSPRVSPRIRLLSIALLTVTAARAQTAAQGWPESTPEEQGLDSRALAGVLENIAAKRLNVHSVTVIRHGHVVMDAYIYPYLPTMPHDLGSVTKSMTAAIAGIAVDKGLLKTDQTVTSLFPGAAQRKFTIGDLLAMSSGLDCGFAPGEKELADMRLTDDWVKFTLALPMKYEPRAKFGYCSPGYHLLSGAITAVTHEPELAFARKNLFEPLGIRDVVWPPDERGVTHGWGDAHLYPRDFAKIGYLYLHGGMWEGKQIVSKAWISKSIAKQADPGRGPNSGYGYGWWLAKTAGLDEFGGNGRGGQIVAVWPQKDMIVVLTGGGYPANEVSPLIAKAIRADAPLPANPDAVKDLRAKTEQAAKAPAPTAIAALPPMAATISGNVYDLPRNASRLENLSITFHGVADALLKVRYQGVDLAIPVSLSGVYHPGPHGPFGLAAGATGRWTSDTNFLVDLNFIANINRYALDIHFDGEDQARIDVGMNEFSGLIRNAHVEGRKR